MDCIAIKHFVDHLWFWRYAGDPNLKYWLTDPICEFVQDFPVHSFQIDRLKLTLKHIHTWTK